MTRKGTQVATARKVEATADSDARQDMCLGELEAFAAEVRAAGGDASTKISARAGWRGALRQLTATVATRADTPAAGDGTGPHVIDLDH
jgi:hypothetical protein